MVAGSIYHKTAIKNDENGTEAAAVTMALMEAMAAGVPVISTDCPCGGPRMLIDNWENGVLISVNGINELVDALNRIFLDDELKKKIGIEGKKSASQFKPEKIYDEWKEYLCKVALKG